MVIPVFDVQREQFVELAQQLLRHGRVVTVILADSMIPAKPAQSV